LVGRYEARRQHTWIDIEETLNHLEQAGQIKIRRHILKLVDEFGEVRTRSHRSMFCARRSFHLNRLRVASEPHTAACDFFGCEFESAP